jgi:hypothetical protein
MPITLNGDTGITTPTEQAATTIGVGNATPSTSGAGITFPATQSPSTDANTLDDYEEGTWTPSPTNITVVSGTPVWTGAYTKIGNIVQAYFAMSGGTVTTTAGSSNITLPITTAVPSDTGVFSNLATGTFAGGLIGYGTVMIIGTTITSNNLSGTIVYRVA